MTKRTIRWSALLWTCFWITTTALWAQDKPEPGVVNELTPDDFARLVFDWREGGEWHYVGDKPCVVDFYASWCVPCRLLRPRLKHLAETYRDEIIVYSIDAESAPNLSYLMGVQAYPTILFIPLRETPTIAVGLLPESDLKRGVEEYLLGTK